MVAAIDVEILARVQNVEPAHPERDRQPSSHGSHPAPPPAASHPPTGATAMARPRKNCVAHVKRFAREYQKITINATGDSTKHNQLSCDAATMNANDISSTKTVASIGDTRPVGISRFAVRGFAASNRASTRRLNPMAALRAVTIHTTIQNT